MVRHSIANFGVLSTATHSPLVLDLLCTPRVAHGKLGGSPKSAGGVWIEYSALVLPGKGRSQCRVKGAPSSRAMSRSALCDDLLCSAVVPFDFFNPECA